MNIIKKFGKKGVLAAVAASAMFCVAPQAEAAQMWRQSWYATGAAMGIVNTDDGSPTIALSGLSTPLPGSIDYSGTFAGSVAVGHEGAFCRKKCGPQNARIEVEMVAGSSDRKRVDLDNLHLNLNDSVKYRAIFLNGMLGVYDTEKMRVWAGAGIGYGQVKVPYFNCNTPCDCLQAVTHEDIAYRAKVQVEREISKTGAVFAEVGYMKFDAGKTSTALRQVDYGQLNLVDLALGLRFYL